MNVTIREDKQTGQLVLFFANHWQQGGNQGRGLVWWLECYTRREQHSEASRAYMQTKCRPCPANREWEAKQLAEHWNALPGGNGEPVSIVSQVRGPKGFTYSGE